MPRGSFDPSLGRTLAALGLRVPQMLPALAVGVVALVVLDLGKTHPVLCARLRGGPTEGARVLSYRLEVVQRRDDEERPVPGRAVSVVARLASGEALSFHGALDAEGAAAVSFPEASVPVSGQVEFRVTLDGSKGAIADAHAQVGVAQWAGGARRRGGWVEGRAVNGLTVRAAAARGAFAVPFADPLLVEARRGGAGVPGTPFDGTVTVEREPGAGVNATEVLHAAPGGPPGRVTLRPLEHATSVPIVARDRDGTTARLDVTLAVVPGALHAELAPGGVLVESPIARERAYVAIVTDTARVAGGAVELRATDRGTASGVLPVALPPEGPLWAVVSSEPDMRSLSLVGWPLREDERSPATTFDVPDVLVVDSVGASVAREIARARRARMTAAIFAAAAIVLSALLVARRARVAGAALQAHLEEAGSDAESTRRVATSGSGSVWLVAVAVLCLILGAALIGVFAAWV